VVILLGTLDIIIECGVGITRFFYVARLGNWTERNLGVSNNMLEQKLYVSSAAAAKRSSQANRRLASSTGLFRE
jgi:hypothetical protein